MKERLFFLICLMLTRGVSWAGIVTGKVCDADTGEELIGATVLTESGQGVATDMERRYSLTLAEGTHMLTVRYIGYQTQTKELEVQQADTAAQGSVEI